MSSSALEGVVLEAGRGSDPHVRLREELVLSVVRYVCSLLELASLVDLVIQCQAQTRSQLLSEKLDWYICATVKTCEDHFSKEG